MKGKSLLALLLVVLMVFSLSGCGNDVPAADDSSTDGAYEITVIIKATDSDYWQSVLLGAKAAAADSNGKIKVATAGPKSETDIDEQVTILENAVIAEPDGIVIASISSDATVPAVEDAESKGIPVATVDNKLNTDKYTQHLATDHYSAAATAAEDMVAKWEAAGLDPSGKTVGVLSADSGSAVNQARCEGFIDKITELVPDIKVLETQYCENDIQQALDASDNLILANEDLIGLFGDNNHMGDGIANSIGQNDMGGQILSYAFDSDDTEIKAIKDGDLTGIVVQNPYGMGYDGVLAVVASLEGQELEQDVVSKTTLVTKENIMDPEVQALLYPGKVPTEEAEKESYDITVIIKATDSDYWQSVLLGAKAAAADSNGKINVSTAGPKSETDIDEQVTILENAVIAEPDGIVIASISSDATVPAVEEAESKGIPVATVDNKLNTDKYTQHLATDHYSAAATAAEDMVAKWEAAGLDPSGKTVGILSADSGSAVNQARCEGFIDKITELVPDIKVLETQYCDNDIQKALDASDNLILANEDLIGLFGDNNHMGDGIANSIGQNDMGGKILSYAFDSDDTEIKAIQDGDLTGIVVQNPYGMGYDGVLAVIASLEGQTLEQDVVSKTTLVTIENIMDSEVQALLYPGK
jgi:ribose transport system substrate-binding protein